MRNSLFVLVMTLIIGFCFVGTSLAMDMGNKRKGKYTYRKVYKSCYQRGEAEQPKPHLNPDAKTQAEWTEVFENRNFNDFGCQDEWTELSDEDISDIYTYLHAHASDSPTPLKCK